MRRHDHPTKLALIDTTVALIDELGPTGFKVEDVLERSGISKGSMYHHFTDFTDLIEAAQIARFAAYVQEDIDGLSRLMQTTKTKDQLLGNLGMLARAVHSPERRRRRMERALIIGASANSERIAKALGIEQQRLTDSMCDIIREVANRGWLREGIQPEALATFILAYSFGKVLDDITENPLDPEQWAIVVDGFLASAISE